MRRRRGTTTALALVLLLATLGVGHPTTPAGASSGDCGLAELQRAADSALGPSAGPVGRSPCPGVRPGAAVTIVKRSGQESICTQNFLFASTDDNGAVRRFVGTAGHCALDGRPGARSFDPGQGPEAHVSAADFSKQLIGHVVYGIVTEERDFALIEILEHIPADPQVCHWGGPSGISRADSNETANPVELLHYGQGFLVSQVAPARTSFATDLSDPHVVDMVGVALFGDSGSPVIHHNGEALGVIVSLGGRATDPGFIRVLRLPLHLDLADAELGTNLKLVTAPLR